MGKEIESSLKLMEEPNSHIVRKRVMRSMWVAIAFVGIILGQTAANGSTAVACSLEDCPGSLYGSAGETFLHYQDNIYLVFDDGRTSLVGFDAQYDYYTVYVMVDGQLLDAGTMGAYAGTVTDIQPTIRLNSSPYTGNVCYAQVRPQSDAPIAYWRIRWNPDVISPSMMLDQIEQGYPIILFDAYASDGSYILTEAPQTDYTDSFEATARSKTRQLFDALTSAVTTGRFFPEKMSDDVTATWEIDTYQHTVTDDFLPNDNTSDSMWGSAGTITDGVSDMVSDKVTVSDDDVTSLFPDETRLDNNVLANVRILTTGIYDTNVVTLLTTSLGMAIIGYLLFGKKES